MLYPPETLKELKIEAIFILDIFLPHYRLSSLCSLLIFHWYNQISYEYSPISFRVQCANKTRTIKVF